MDRMWDYLQDILESHLQCHKLLLHFAEEKRRALIENHVDTLLSILKEEEDVLKKVQDLEEKRQDLLSRMDIGAVLSFQEVLRQAPQNRTVAFNRLQKELLLVLEELQHKNDGNAILINESLELNEFSMQLFTGGNEARAYRPNQGRMKEVNYRLFDEKV